MKIKSKIWIKIFKGAMIPVIFIAVWQLAGNSGKINVSVLSTPEKILEGWKTLWRNGKYGQYFLDSLLRFFKGYFAGSIAGLFFGIVLGLSKRAEDFLGPLASLLRSIPLIAWVPIVILSIGVGEKTRIILIAIGCFWAVFLNTMDGIKCVDPRYIEVAKVLEKNPTQVIISVILPAAFPAIVTGLRSGLTNAWRSIVAAEMIGTSSGIGFIISYGREISRPDYMYVGLITVAIIGLILDLLLIKLQNSILVKYYGKD